MQHLNCKINGMQLIETSQFVKQENNNFTTVFVMEKLIFVIFQLFVFKSEIAQQLDVQYVLKGAVFTRRSRIFIGKYINCIMQQEGIFNEEYNYSGS